MPETQSQEKKDMLRLCGAELRLVPAVPYKDPNNYVKVSRRVAEELTRTEPKGAILADQWDNLANRRAHYEGTGPEIWRQTDGRVDAFVSAIGTGGTISGVGIALKERKPEVRIVLADPPGAAMYSWFAHGELKSEGSSITEGIGQGRVTKNVEGAPVVGGEIGVSGECVPYCLLDIGVAAVPGQGLGLRGQLDDPALEGDVRNGDHTQLGRQQATAEEQMAGPPGGPLHQRPRERGVANGERRRG
jgi:hypothetical protein